MRKHKNLNAMFQIDSLSQLNPETDSSLDIIKEGLKLGETFGIVNGQGTRSWSDNTAG